MRVTDETDDERGVLDLHSLVLGEGVEGGGDLAVLLLGEELGDFEAVDVGEDISPYLFEVGDDALHPLAIIYYSWWI